MSVKKIVRCAFLLAIGVLVNYIEHLIPLPFMFPGAKLGLANAIGIVALLTLGPGYYVGYVFLRVLLSALLWNGFGSAFMISLSGCTLACIFTLIFYYFRRFSIYGVSVIGAVMHGVGQVIMVAILYNTVYMFLYMIIMAIAGIITGMLVAYISGLIIKRINPKYEKTESI